MRILIGNDKGGVGKTTASDFIISAYDAAGVPLAVGEIDREQKLSAMLKADGRKVDMTIAPPDTDQLVDSKELIRFFTPALTFFKDHKSAILDCGANLSTMLLRTAELVDAHEIIDPTTMTIIACTTNDGQSVAGAKAMLTAAAKAFPGSRMLVVANDKDGPVNEGVFAGLAEAVIRIKRNDTRICTDLVSAKLVRVSVAANLDEEAAQKLFPDTDFFGARSITRTYRRWFNEVTDQLNDAFDLKKQEAAE